MQKAISDTGIYTFGCKENDHDALIVKRMIEEFIGAPSEEQKERDREMLVRRMMAEVRQEIRESEVV